MNTRLFTGKDWTQTNKNGCGRCDYIKRNGQCAHVKACAIAKPNGKGYWKRKEAIRA